MKATWSTASTIATFMGILSVLMLLDQAATVGWIPVIKTMLIYYQFVKEFVLTPISPVVVFLVDLASELISIDLQLQPHWSDVFVLVSLYLGARARSYWGAGLKKRAVFRGVWGTIIGLFTGVVAGLADPSTLIGNIKLLGTVVVGLAIFDIFDAAWSATFHRKIGFSWGQDWFRYLAFSMPTIAIGVIVLSLFRVLYSWLPKDYFVNFGIIVLLGYSIALAFYWLYRGLKSSQSRDKPGTGFEKFLTSSNYQIGFLMLRSLGGAFIVVMFNAGYSLISH